MATMAKFRVRIAQVLSILLGIFFAIAGARKLLGWPWGMHAYLQGGWPLWVYYATAVNELLAGLGLIVPRTRLAAVTSLIAMILIVVWAPAGVTRAGVINAAISIVFLLAAATSRFPTSQHDQLELRSFRALR